MLRFGWSPSITAIAAFVCALALPVGADADTINLVWDPSPDSSVIGYILYAEGPGYSRSFDVGDDVSFSFTEAVAGQQYCFAVAAYASASRLSPRSSQVCGYSNAPPVLTPIGNRSSSVGQPASLQLDGDDPEGQPLTYTAAGLPPGLSLQSSTGFISGTPTTSGTYNVTITVRDGVLSSVGTFTWSIVAPDGSAPSITITSPTSATSYSTSSGSLTVRGSASDNSGVSQVTWVNSRGGSGTASGTTSWTVSLGLSSGSNVITVTARDAAGNQASDTLTVNYSAPAGPLALTSLTSDRSAPQTAGTAITFTATVTGGTAPQQFKWWVYDGTNWFVTRNWSTANTWTWTPTVANTAYRVSAWARSATSTADMYDNNQSNLSIAFPISGSSSSTPNPPPSGPSSGGVLTLTSLSADRPAPQPAGSTITFTASATGGSSPYQYKWWIFNGTDWVVTQQWTTNNRWTWTPNSGNSAARVAVWVRNAGSSADAYDNGGSNGSIPYPISSGSTPSTPSVPSGGALTLTSLSADRVAPQPVGTSVTFTALAAGGAAPYQYKWWTYDGANWVVRREWSTSNTWTWTPTSANSSYRVAVWVRNAGSSADAYDNAASNGSISFAITSSGGGTVTPPPAPSTGPLTLTGISPSRSAPSPRGTAVTFTASISGGVGPQQFKWWVYDGSAWYAMTGWSTSNTWTWTPPSANSRLRVAVWVRNAGSTADSYDNAQSNGSIAFPVN
jgi:hypothetical protein